MKRFNGFTLAEVKKLFPSPQRGEGRISTRSMSVRNSGEGFTLAEVLITLGIIGVVAAVSMPILIQNVNERVNAEREANIAFKINQAMEKMRALGLLNSSYGSTEAFVDELQNHLKIAKRCDSAHIAECWPTAKVIDTNGEEYEVSKAKTGKDLQLETTTNNVGIVLADGAAIILNYNPDSKTYDVGDPISASKNEKAVGGKFYTTNLTAGLAYVTDVNGRKGPNSQQADKRNDIRSFNGAKFGTGCAGTDVDGTCVYIVDSYEPVTDASKSTFIAWYDSGCPGAYCSWYTRKDYWQGAIDKCDSLKMKLPTKDELLALYGKSWEGKPTRGRFWSSSDIYALDAWNVDFDDGRSYGYNKHNRLGVLCVGD